MSVDFADFIASSRAALQDRAARLNQELDQLQAEMKAIDAYERERRKQPGSPRGVRGSGFYPWPGDGTLSVPEAGKQFLGLSESGSWLAWRRGDIPSFKVGRYRRVKIDVMRRKMEGRPPPARSKVREEDLQPVAE